MDGWQYLAYLAVKSSLGELHDSYRSTPARRSERRTRRRRPRHGEDG